MEGFVSLSRVPQRNPRRYSVLRERLWVPLVLAAGAFALDLITPRGAGGGVVYVVALFGAIWVRSPRAPLFVAAFLTPLTMLGYWLSPAAASPDPVALVNRAAGLVALWAAALLLVRRASAETAERAAEERFRLMIESSPVAMVVTDAEGRIARVNARTEKLFGYGRKELEGQSIEVLIPERLRGRHTGFRRAFLSHPQTRPMGAGRDLCGQRKDGTEFPIEIGLNTIVTDEGPFTLSSMVDITERQRTAEALRESEERFSKAFRASPDALVISRASDGLIRDVNESYLRLFGYERPEELIGHRVMMRGRHVEPGDRDRLVEIFQREGHVRDLELTIRRCSGELRTVLCSIEPLEIAGEPWTLTLLRDVTEHRQADEHRELLIGELAHRVKNTLAVVQAVASQTLREARSLDEFVPKFTGRVRALAAAHDLLLSGHWKPVALQALVEQSLEPYPSEPGRRRTRTEGPVVLIEAHTAVSLSMALHELATNAAKHGALTSPAGQVQVRWQLAASGARPAVELHWCERGGPPVVAPRHAGFGSRLIQNLSREFDGDIVLAFEPEGFECRMRVPVASASVVLVSSHPVSSSPRSGAPEPDAGSGAQ